MNRLLQYRLPKLTKPLPDTWLVHAGISGRDETELGIKGFSRHVFTVPRPVLDAVAEYWERERTRRYYSMFRAAGREPTWQEQIEVLLGIWLLYRRELEYVDFEPVTTAVTKYENVPCT